MPTETAELKPGMVIVYHSDGYPLEYWLVISYDEEAQGVRLLTYTPSSEEFDSGIGWEYRYNSPVWSDIDYTVLVP